MFEYLKDRFERWLASQVKAVVRDTFSPAVMQRAVDALRNEFKAEMRAYRREKEEEMGRLMAKHDRLIASFSKINEIVNKLKTENRVLHKALSLCPPLVVGQMMTEIEIRQLIKTVEDDMIKNEDVKSLLVDEIAMDVNDTLLEILEGPGNGQ